jgi:hypothetical protein
MYEEVTRALACGLAIVIGMLFKDLGKEALKDRSKEEEVERAERSGVINGKR